MVLAATSLLAVMVAGSPSRPSTIPWLQEQETQHSISELLAMDWPGLSIEPLIAPEDLRLLIGWTGSPASTSDLVDQVHRSREDKMAAYQLFLKNSTECVNEMIKGFKEDNVTLIQQMIREKPTITA